MGGAFAASVKPLVQHGRALTKYFGERHSHLQADLVAACQRHNLLSVISSMLLSLAMFLESVRKCFGTSSGTERPLLVKLPIEKSVVKLLPSASSLCSSYYLTRFAQPSNFIY